MKSWREVGGDEARTIGVYKNTFGMVGHSSCEKMSLSQSL